MARSTTTPPSASTSVRRQGRAATAARSATRSSKHEPPPEIDGATAPKAHAGAKSGPTAPPAKAHAAKAATEPAPAKAHAAKAAAAPSRKATAGAKSAATEPAPAKAHAAKAATEPAPAKAHAAKAAGAPSKKATVGAKSAPTAAPSAAAPPAKAHAPKAATEPVPAKAHAAKAAAAPHAKTAAAPNRATPATGRKAPVVEKPAETYAGDTAFLDQQRRALLDERATYVEQAQLLRAEAESLVEEMEPGDVQFDEESGEGGTTTVDRERDLALSAQALAAVEEIDAALERIATGRYGICEGCGQLILRARLEALPYARLCIACKSGGLSRR